tara:strand:- start:372 stop:653 length:282 start_codon:yes stop_codon:yes gene_type:complete
LGGQATGAQYFRSLSNCFVLEWLTIIPFVQYITGLWLLALNIFILNKIHKLSMVKAIILALLPAILVVLVAIFAISYFGVLSPEAFLPEATTP